MENDVDFPGNDGCIRQRSEESGAATDYVEVEVDLRKNVKLETNEAFLPLAKKRDLSACSQWKKLLLRMKASVYCECQSRIVPALSHTHYASLRFMCHSPAFARCL